MDAKGLGQALRVTRWKPAPNVLAITFADRMPAAETLLDETPVAPFIGQNLLAPAGT